jgi:hypothetical protein
MSKILAHLFLFCDENKDSSTKLKITKYAPNKEVSEYFCEGIEFEMASYDSLNVIENKGQRVVSFMIQGCTANFEDKHAKLVHSDALYLEFEFIQ